MCHFVCDDAELREGTKLAQMQNRGWNLPECIPVPRTRIAVRQEDGCGGGMVGGNYVEEWRRGRALGKERMRDRPANVGGAPVHIREHNSRPPWLIVAPLEVEACDVVPVLQCQFDHPLLAQS